MFPVAVEAGGVANATPGIDPSGDATANDFDPDGDPLSVIASVVATAPAANRTRLGRPGLGGTAYGTYGTLTIGANGTFTYVVDNNKAAVQALRTGRTR